MGAELSGGMITYMSPAARAPLLASVIHVTLSCNLRFNVQCSVATGNMSERGAGRCIGDMSVVGRSVGRSTSQVGRPLAASATTITARPAGRKSLQAFSSPTPFSRPTNRLAVAASQSGSGNCRALSHTAHVGSRTKCQLHEYSCLIFKNLACSSFREHEPGIVGTRYSRVYEGGRQLRQVDRGCWLGELSGSPISLNLDSIPPLSQSRSACPPACLPSGVPWQDTGGGDTREREGGGSE